MLACRQPYGPRVYSMAVRIRMRGGPPTRKDGQPTRRGGPGTRPRESPKKMRHRSISKCRTLHLQKKATKTLAARVRASEVADRHLPMAGMRTATGTGSSLAVGLRGDCSLRGCYHSDARWLLPCCLAWWEGRRCRNNGCHRVLFFFLFALRALPDVTRTCVALVDTSGPCRLLVPVVLCESHSKTGHNLLRQVSSGVRLSKQYRS
ncbi:hypothetical protein CSUI_006209 [Cystoisospora suis]|uniref:Uncharacterized protein n=1 Tax=Cystoisospora suis TaxID=483139 RepID=A0A2C6KSL3_9APIC|nr:hypothetical protein CSUI_006209 [Cystoisospora suis]